MFWTYDHEVILCRGVVNVNPYTTKKGSTQRSSMWEKIADTLNKCTVPKFRVDKRSVRDHVGILVYKHKKKLQAEEKATGITPDEPTELENLLDTITALEESGEAELQETQGTSSKKLQYHRAKAEDVQLKAMEKLSEIKKRDSSADESDDKPKRQRRSGGDDMQYLAERAKDEEGASNTRERENGGLEESANPYAAATATKPTAVTKLSDDDDGAATAAVKGFDGVIGKNNTYNK